MKKKSVPVFVTTDPEPSLMILEKIGDFELNEAYDPGLRENFFKSMVVEIHDQLAIKSPPPVGYTHHFDSVLWPINTLIMTVKSERVFTDHLGLKFNVAAGSDVSYAAMATSNERGMIIPEHQWEDLFDFPQFTPIDHKPVTFVKKTPLLDEALVATGVFETLKKPDWLKDELDADAYKTLFEGTFETEPQPSALTMNDLKEAAKKMERGGTRTSSAYNPFLDELDMRREMLPTANAKNDIYTYVTDRHLAKMKAVASLLTESTPNSKSSGMLGRGLLKSDVV